MVERARGRKKSLFPAKTTIEAGAEFDYFANGINFRISADNLLTALGVTGTLVNVGDASATEILQTVGSENRIRRLEDGAGIFTEISAQNGITIKHNFAIDETGFPLMLNKTAASPDIVSLVAKLGITLTAVDNTIEILNNAAQQIQTELADYQALANDDIVHFTGTNTLTLVNIASAIKEITIGSETGTTTLAGDATIQAPTTVSAGSAVTLYPAAGKWWHK